jgi:hypothetical protein
MYKKKMTLIALTPKRLLLRDLNALCFVTGRESGRATATPAYSIAERDYFNEELRL